jgi:signal transduction histidine kinase
MSSATAGTVGQRRSGGLVGSVSLLLAGLAVVIAGVLDPRVGPDREALGLPTGWLDTGAGLLLAGAGAVVLARGRHPLGYLMAVFGAWWSIDSLAGIWLGVATTHDPPLTGASTAFWLYQRLGATLLFILPLVLLLYPDGRLPGGRLRVPALLSLAMTAVLPVAVLLAPSDQAQLAAAGEVLPAAYDGLELDPASLPLPDALWQVILGAAYVLAPASLLVPFAAVVTAYRASTGIRRMRLRWLLWAGLMDVLVMLSIFALPQAVSSYGLTLCVAVTAGAVAIGLTRPEIVDVDRLLNSTILYGALVVVSFLLDLLILGTAGRLLDAHVSQDQALVVAVFVVSLVYAPLRHRLWRVVRRSARGERDDPYAVVSGLAERLESSDTPQDQLLEVAAAVARAFRTSYVGVEVLQADGQRLLVEHGSAPTEWDSMPVSYRGEQIGRLLLSRGPRAALRTADERLLADVVRQAAAAARTSQLADELQTSRERLVTAIADERRRLRNELHDGLGPTLAAVASRIDMARLAGAPDDDGSLRTAREEITGLLAEVRRLVHGLRPPALDDVGLVGAVRQLVDRLRAPGLTVQLDVPERLDGLPAAVEVAAYRIVSEALTNVVRHAAATKVGVSLARRGEWLVVEVADDGCGIEREAKAGVGLISLRERAIELGGSSAVAERTGGGTLVRAELPLTSNQGRVSATAKGAGE